MGYDLGWVAKPTSELRAKLLENWTAWEKCRRWYKWLSMLPLFLSYLMLFVSAACFGGAMVLLGVGACCSATGESMGKTAWFDVDSSGRKTYSHTEDHGAAYKCFGAICAIAGFACILSVFVCYYLSYFFLAVTFISWYEEIDLEAPREFFVLVRAKNIPETMNIYTKMDRKSAKAGTVSTTDVIEGQNVYTGWILCASEPQAWIYCNRRGTIIFRGFTTQEEAQSFAVEQQSISSGGGASSLEAGVSTTSTVVDGVQMNPMERGGDDGNSSETVPGASTGSNAQGGGSPVSPKSVATTLPEETPITVKGEVVKNSTSVRDSLKETTPVATADATFVEIPIATAV